MLPSASDARKPIVPLIIVPSTVKAALAWIATHHSHHEAPNGGLFAVGVAERDSRRLVCVALAGRPAARMLQSSGPCVEVTRTASDGSCPHAASMSLGAIRRAAIALGYTRLVSYTLLGEAGTSYRAAGWHPAAVSEGGQWSRAGRPRAAAGQAGVKIRWECGPDALMPPPEERARLDALIRESVGAVPLRSRSIDDLPLFAKKETT